MGNSTIAVSDQAVCISQLEIARKDVADFFRTVPDTELETVFIQAVEVGVFCLERARTSQDTEFVRRQIDTLLNRVESAVEKIPTSTQEALVERIGTDNGQVLAPLKIMVEEASRATSDRLRDIRHLLENEITHCLSLPPDSAVNCTLGFQPNPLNTTS